MDLAISALIILVLIFTSTFTMLDVSRNMTIQQDIFTSLRSANQNALLDIKDDYESRDEITEARMIQEWLVNFLDNNNLNYRDVTLKFTYLSTDPPTYTVEVVLPVPVGPIAQNVLPDLTITSNKSRISLEA